MATLNVPNVNKTPMMAAVYGNASFKYVEYTLLVGAAIADVINFIRLPRDIRIVDFYETHDGAITSATTANFGLAAVPGGTTTLVNATYFLAAADLNAAGRNRWGNLASYPVLTDGEYYIQAVLAGATVAGSNMKIGVYVQYEYVGN
jgi:hypothetical protein